MPSLKRGIGGVINFLFTKNAPSVADQPKLPAFFRCVKNYKDAAFECTDNFMYFDMRHLGMGVAFFDITLRLYIA